MKLIVGLGNYGKEYDNTRHNIGFMSLDNYLHEVKWEKKNNALYYKDKDVIFIKPLTYMNLSGNAVRYFMDYYKIDIDDILIIQDDISLDIGKIRLKKNSSAGGHNGIKNIIECLGTDSFLRLKIGVSSPGNQDLVNYVLGRFNKNEVNTLNTTFVKCNDVINDFINEFPLQDMMNRYN